MFWNIVASVGAKYIIKSHLLSDRWSLTNNIFQELDEVFLYINFCLIKSAVPVRLYLSADKCDSCLPSLSLYFNIYFAPTDATMFQNIQQFHSGGSNTNSFRLLATLFITKNSIDMRILCSELSQLKRIAIGLVTNFISD